MAEPEKDQSWSLFKALGAPKLTTTSPYSLPRVLGLASAPVAVDGRTNSEPVAAGRTPSNLRPIKTPHSYPASHPEKNGLMILGTRSHRQPASKAGAFLPART